MQIAEQTPEQIAQRCLQSAYDGSMDFPNIVGTLMRAGFESYDVDYRRHCNIYYKPNGESIVLPIPQHAHPVAAVFDVDAIRAAIHEAQTHAVGYTYQGFCDKVIAAGCAGYKVSFLGKRAVYFGRTAETHVEHFPQ